jgi:hypothetical protein
VLPLGIGWSLWIHLFVQYPKTISAVMLVGVLSIVPVKQTGLGTSHQSVARTMLCSMTGDAPAMLCSRGWAETVREKAVEP